VANFKRIPAFMWRSEMSTRHPVWLNDAPHQWRPGTLHRGRLQAQAAALRQRPGFDALARRFAHCWLHMQAAHPVAQLVARGEHQHRRDAAMLAPAAHPLQARAVAAQEVAQAFAKGRVVFDQQQSQAGRAG
jgi:hypothetical protein